jgi:hypothetical protein
MASFSCTGTASKMSSQARGGQQHDDDAVDHHEGHRLWPGDLVDDAEREEGIDAESGRERERQPRHQAEQDRHDPGGQRGRCPHGGERQLVAGDIRLARQDDRLRITMYAIVTKVTSPPRISPPIVEPRRLISKKRSSARAGRRRNGRRTWV